MKIIGVIGGMGPLATLDFLKKVIDLTDASSDAGHVHTIVDINTEIPDRTNFILNGGESPVNELIKSAVKLENSGASALVMPCNTAHYFYDDIAKGVTIPVISMIEETAKEMSNNGVKKCTLLATTGTYKTQIYVKKCANFGIEVLIPDSYQQNVIQNSIYAIKSGKDVLDVEFKNVLNQLRGESDLFVLGCTEIPIIFNQYKLDEKHIDPTEILAKSVIRFAGKKMKNEA